ncbi:MAG: radical SAM protein [Chloroflexi bacterium]|nr:radical SAM protein [Chloroflexota bacterium]
MVPEENTNSFFLSGNNFEPAYLSLYRTGELQKRAKQAVENLRSCFVCPRDCAVDRLANRTATCKIGRYAQVTSHFAHLGEEDCLRGWKGSGTIFFSQCNLRCVFCQNFDTSQSGQGIETSPRQLAAMMLELQAMGCHNINFVTPEHVVPQILEALPIAIKAGLRLPIVYNTSAYDSLESLRLLDGIVDIYMPDFKFWDERLSLHYLKAKDYPEVARQAIKEMHRQVGELLVDEHGIAMRGVLVRHLIMPGNIAGTEKIAQFLAQEISADTYINVMAQYHPAGKVSADKYPEINQRISNQEYADGIRAAKEAGLWRLDERKPRFLFFR